MDVRLRPVVRARLAVLVASVTVPSFSAIAGAAEPQAEEPGALASVPDPGAGAETSSGPPAPPVLDSTPAQTSEAAISEPAAPPSASDAEVASPEVPEAEASASPASAPEPVDAGVDPSLLDAKPEPTQPVATRPAPAGEPVASAGLSPEERAAALDAAYAARYRPAHNPVRLNIAGRIMFANVGGRDRVNGRVGGAAVDIGPAWNRAAIAATFTGWGGRIQLSPDSGEQLNAMLGGGLTGSLGRLALMTHGYLDLRVGYDVYYGAVNRRGDAPAILAPQADDPQVVATLTENLLPHGPRVRLDMGLVGSGSGRFFHGLGLSLGYQALVGSLRGDLPFTNMLTLGFSYWMG